MLTYPGPILEIKGSVWWFLKRALFFAGHHWLAGAIALSYPPFFIDDSGAEFHVD